MKREHASQGFIGGNTCREWDETITAHRMASAVDASFCDITFPKKLFKLSVKKGDWSNLERWFQQTFPSVPEEVVKLFCAKSSAAESGELKYIESINKCSKFDIPVAYFTIIVQGVSKNFLRKSQTSH